MEKILLTGGAGYIGSHIAVALAEAGYKPIILDNFSRSETQIPERIDELCGYEVPLYAIDCRDKRGMLDLITKEGGIDGVIHLAAYKAVGESVLKPIAYFDNNLSAMCSLMEVMVEEKINRFVFSSSCTVYGVPKVQEVSEDMPHGNVHSPYGYTKQACERLMSDVAKSEQWLRQVSLRYFNPIGAHPSARLGELPIGVPNNLIPYITQAAAGLREKVVIYGNDYDTPDGTCIRDYIHVCDLAEAHVLALKRTEVHHAPLEVFNIGTGKGNSVKEIIDTFQEVNGVSLNTEYGDRRPGDIDAIFANASKAMKTLNWQPKYTVNEALKHAWQWQKSLGA